MLARYAGASLGFPAFTFVVTAGLIAQVNSSLQRSRPLELTPETVTLSHDIFALFLFGLIGVVLGRVAQMVVAEHEHKWDTEIRKRYHGMQAATAGNGPENKSTDQADGSMAS